MTGIWINPVISDPFLLGQENNRNGVTFDCNPYPNRTEYYYRWQAGWIIEDSHTTIPQKTWALAIVPLLKLGFDPEAANNYATECAREAMHDFPQESD